MFNFVMRKMLEAKMKDVPSEDRDKIFSMLEKNPELFTQIARDVKAKTDSGMDQMKAVMEVMQKYQAELNALKEEEK